MEEFKTTSCNPGFNVHEDWRPIISERLVGMNKRPGNANRLMLGSDFLQECFLNNLKCVPEPKPGLLSAIPCKKHHKKENFHGICKIAMVSTKTT